MKQASNIAVLVLLALAIVTAGPARAADAEEADAEPRYRCSSELGVCLDWMATHYGKRGWAGLQLDRSDGQYTVIEIHDGSPAQKAKVRPGDILVAINGVDFIEENNEKLVAIQDKMKPGAQFTYTVKRNGKRRNVDVVLIGMPFEVVAQMVGMHLLTDHVDIDVAFSAED
jgi:predicted metalloprotease with PDZ domain